MKFDKYDIITLLGMAILITILYSLELHELVEKYIIVFMGTSYLIGKYVENLNKND